MYERPLVGTPSDYSNPANWLALPSETPLDVDVVYLIPSACMDPEAGKVCAVDDPAMRGMGAAYFNQQATCFEGVGNIFAPWWRQVNAALLPSMSYEEVDDLEFAGPRTDVYAALDYFFENLNCFEGVGNIFAPWWRQVNAALLPSMSYEEVDDLEFAGPRTDVYAALD